MSQVDEHFKNAPYLAQQGAILRHRHTATCCVLNAKAKKAATPRNANATR
jgi:hypothetical protein